VSHCRLAIYIKKYYLKAKEELCGNSISTQAKISSFKNPHEKIDLLHLRAKIP
jgi:oligoribonuclease (3'-5' exoribonuclease)